MKTKTSLTLAIALISHNLSAQTVIGGVNSGAISANNMMVSVGEIFVNPTNVNETNSGTLGILYSLELRVVGVDEAVSENGISVFPNPAHNFVTVQTTTGTPQIASFKILDIQGRQVATAINQDNTIDLSNLPSGVYFIKSDLDSIKSIKIVKQ